MRALSDSELKTSFSRDQKGEEGGESAYQATLGAPLLIALWNAEPATCHHLELRNVGAGQAEACKMALMACRPATLPSLTSAVAQCHLP